MILGFLSVKNTKTCHAMLYTDIKRMDFMISLAFKALLKGELKDQRCHVDRLSSWWPQLCYKEDLDNI